MLISLADPANIPCGLELHLALSAIEWRAHSNCCYINSTLTLVKLTSNLLQVTLVSPQAKILSESLRAKSLSEIPNKEFESYFPQLDCHVNIIPLIIL